MRDPLTTVLTLLTCGSFGAYTTYVDRSVLVDPVVSQSAQTGLRYNWFWTAALGGGVENDASLDGEVAHSGPAGKKTVKIRACYIFVYQCIYTAIISK